MESNSDLNAIEHQLADAERLGTVAWTEYPPTPLWFFPAVGAWFAFFMLCMLNMWDNAVWIAPMIGAVVLEGAFIGWMTKRRGVFPRLSTMPAEFAPAARWYAVGVAVVVGVGFALMYFVSMLLGAAVVFTLSTAGLYWYEQGYERAAAATRARVGTA